MNEALQIIPVAVIVGMIELVKKFNVKERWCPVIALALGIIISLGSSYNSGNVNVYECLMTGIVYGLSASGLYSGVKATTNDFGAKTKTKV
jgi:hypothetical protein